MAELRHIKPRVDIPMQEVTTLNSDKPYLQHTDQSKEGYDNKGYNDINDYSQHKNNVTSGDVDITTGNASGHNSQDRDDDDDEEENGCSLFILRLQTAIFNFLKENSTTLRTAFYVILILLYFTYFGLAMSHEFGDEGSWRLMIITALVTVGLTINFMYQLCSSHDVDHLDDEKGSSFTLVFQRVVAKLRLSKVLPVLMVLAFITFVVVEIAIPDPGNLISLAGMAFFVLTFFIFSHNPSRVKWRPVFWGISIQIIFAILILRTSWGYNAFRWLGDRITEFLASTDAGSRFLFAQVFEEQIFAFKVLPVVVFFSTIVSMLYHLGVMQVIIKMLGRFLSWTLGTSPIESVNAAGNIFIGQTEAPLMIRPFLKDITNSEMHAVMTGGFATIAGSVMAAYILIDVPANHLLSASVMSAPAALAMSKLFYPETEKTRARAEDVYNIAKGTDHNIVEAASNGAVISVKLVANIAVNLIAFVALLEFVNSTLVWFGDRVGRDDFTFQFICSYVFWPVAFLMGVDRDDCRVVGELVGTKTFLNEFVAYSDLSVYIKNQEALDDYLHNATVNATGNLTGYWFYKGRGIFLNDTGVLLEKGTISDRSVVIATYALCGFSNLGSIGVQLGALGAMAPNRRGDMARIVVRAMLAGNVACFMTACIAGLLYEGDI